MKFLLTLPLALAALLASTTHAAPSAEGPGLAPVALASPSGAAELWIAAAGHPGIDAFDPATGKLRRLLDLDATPTGIAAVGARQALVSLKDDAGTTLLVETAPTPRVLRRATVGRHAAAPVVAHDASRAWVVSHREHQLVEFTLPSLQETRRLDLGRQPVCAALTPDGATLLVGHLLPDQPEDAPVLASQISIIDLAQFTVTRREVLPDGSTALRSLLVSPDGRHAYATHVIGRYRMPVTQLDRGWMMTNALTVLDLAQPANTRTVLLDSPLGGIANPWELALSADGKTLHLTASGADALVSVDRAALHARIAARSRPGALPLEEDLTFSKDLLTRVELPGYTPRALLLAGDTLYVAGYYNDRLASLSADGRLAREWSLSNEAPDAARRGERHFQTAANCYQQWLSCTSCHVDSRVDGLTWDLVGDGLGNPATTANLAVRLRRKTHSEDIKSVRAGLRAGFHVEQFSEPTDAVIDDLIAYFRGIDSVSETETVKHASAR